MQVNTTYLASVVTYTGFNLCYGIPHACTSCYSKNSVIFKANAITPGLATAATPVVNMGAPQQQQQEQMQALLQQLAAGQKVVLLTDGGKALSTAIFYQIQEGQQLGALPPLKS